jgi:hypothetical protein
MALSMEEQRILAQIEQELARSEPVLAARLSAFGSPVSGALRTPRGRAWGRGEHSAGPRKRLHSPRVLVVASLVALVLLTVIPVTVYALVSLRAVSRGHPARHSAVSAQHHPVQPIISPPK